MDINVIKSILKMINSKGLMTREIHDVMINDLPYIIMTVMSDFVAYTVNNYESDEIIEKDQVTQDAIVKLICTIEEKGLMNDHLETVFIYDVPKLIYPRSDP